MAILRMKRLRLIAVRSRKEELLRELTRLGCVEISEAGEELPETESLRPESSGVMAARTRLASLDHALELLGQYAPVKSRLLSAKPELAAETFLEDDGIDDALALAEKITELHDQVRRIGAEESRLRTVLESLQPWMSLDLPLECGGTERTELVLGAIPGKVSFSTAVEALRDAADEAELFPVSEDKSARYVALLCMKEQMPAAQEALRSFGFTAAALGGLSGTPREAAAAAEESLSALAAQKAELVEQIKADSGHRDELKLASDKLSTRVAMAEAEERLVGTDSTLILEGWMPAEREQELEQVFKRFDCAWECRDPEPDEYPEVPVKLKNNQVTNALNMVTNMYSLPAYGTVDPNPLMAPFFILFYGLMMADMGYGLIMIVAALVAMKKIKPRGGTLSFCQLLLYGGIATFICGALTGGLFGNAPEVIAGMFGSDWKGLPALFSPVRDSTLVLYGAMALGVIHLNAGMVVSFLEKKKNGNLADGIFEEGSLWVILLGGILLALDMLGILRSRMLHNLGLAILIVGAAMLLFGAGRHSKGIGKLTAAFGVIYNTLTGWFGDILSYSRIMALMLAGGVVAQVFNTIAAMPSANGVTPLSGAIFIVIFLIGHALNFGLNLLGCFVHDLRLQCLEFFGKFYQDGGRPFAPLSVRTRFINPEE